MNQVARMCSGGVVLRTLQAQHQELDTPYGTCMDQSQMGKR